METRELTCIICPRGCRLVAMLEGKTVIEVSGNTCKRGKIYAENECTNPMRTLTTTAKTSNGGIVAVKSEIAIPKEKLFECMQIINSTVVELPVRTGDVVIKNVFGSNIVATQSKDISDY